MTGCGMSRCLVPCEKGTLWGCQYGSMLNGGVCDSITPSTSRTFPGPINELKEEAERPLTICEVGRRGGTESIPVPRSEVS